MDESGNGNGVPRQARSGAGGGPKAAGASKRPAKPRATRPKSLRLGPRLMLFARRSRALIHRLGWRRITLTAALAIAFGGGFYLAQVYREISALIEQRRAALSSAIYSAPLEIEVGDELGQLHLMDRLADLSYSRVAAPSHPGEYAVASGLIDLYQREFNIGTINFPALLVHLSIGDGRITGVANAFGVALDHADLNLR